MVFDPDTQDLHCDHCGRHQPIDSPSLTAPEYLYNPDTDEYNAPDWNAEGSHSLRCTGCGAEIVVSSASLTAQCPFCGGNYVVDPDDLKSGILPETIMPFRISFTKAAELFRQWVRRRFWAPRKFRKAVLTPDNLTGVYLPFWTYDADLSTEYSGQGGRRHTVTRTRQVNGKTETYTTTEIRWYPIGGKCGLHFNDETVCATRAVDTGLTAGLGHFTTDVLRRFSPAYLSGFAARRYDIGLGKGFSIARSSMEAEMERTVKSREGYDEYRGMSYRHQYDGVRFKHVLLPVWISSYRFRNKVYRFIVNGETGLISGKSPVSGWKIAALVLGVLALVAGVFLLTRYFGGSGVYTGGYSYY